MKINFTTCGLTAINFRALNPINILIYRPSRDEPRDFYETQVKVEEILKNLEENRIQSHMD